MPKYFNTIKLKISDEEKKLRLEDYRYALENGYYFGPPVDIDEFVRFKCLNCGTEHDEEYDILLEIWDESISDYPKIYCENCGKESSVPLDVYHKQTLKVFR
jgi:DNA-directed RNA polymerase subunit RPC12/RpoP